MNQKSDDDDIRILGAVNQTKSDDDATKILTKPNVSDYATKIMDHQGKQKDVSDKTMVINSKPLAIKEPEFVTIGRSKENNIVLQNNLKISGEHCKIRCINFSCKCQM